MKGWVPYKNQFMDDYIQGQRPFTRENLIRDLRLMAGLSPFEVKFVIEKINKEARGDKNIAIGRLLFYRYNRICARLN